MINKLASRTHRGDPSRASEKARRYGMDCLKVATSMAIIWVVMIALISPALSGSSLLADVVITLYVVVTPLVAIGSYIAGSALILVSKKTSRAT